MPARRTAACLPPALLAAALLGTGLTGCGETSSAGDGAPALTKDQARDVLTGYTAAANRAGQRLDHSALRTVQADPQLAMDTASFKLRRVVRARPQALKFERVQYYIPRLSGHPRWFAADATTGSGKLAVRHALLFTQARPGAPWLLTADPYPSGPALSRVALDPEGYATAVSPNSGGLAVAPGRLAAAHAALLTGGPRAPGASVLAGGSATDQSHAALLKGREALAQRGITLSTRFTAAPYQTYALRTRDRGALVWYVVKQTEAYSAPAPGKLAVKGDLVGLAPARSVRRRMDTTVLVQYLALVPPAGRAAVAGMYRKAVTAHGS
ncbi:hypothetical protein [Spirillospora albida]|uniref:hypothetical protein n=1 Tax=Spirillospora albida TaxID=58123 RepID=UPI0004C19351|nr:hypothetical protein [Spirillospora albida]